MVGFSHGRAGDTLVVLQRARQIGVSYEYDVRVAGFHAGAQVWKQDLRLLRDSLDIWDGPRGPIIATNAPTQATSGVETGNTTRLVALDRANGRVVWQRDFNDGGPSFVPTSAGDLLGTYGSGTGQRTLLLDGRTGKAVFDAAAPGPQSLGDVNGDGKDDDLFDYGYLDGRKGAVVHGSGLVVESHWVVPINDVDGDGASDVWSYATTSHLGQLLSGKTFKVIWQEVENPAPAVRVSKSTNRVARMAVAATLGGKRAVVVFREGVQRMTAFDAATGSVLWEYRQCDGLNEPDRTVCQREP